MKVAIVLRYVHQYRLPFLDALYAKSQEKGIKLEIFYGQPTEEEEARNDKTYFRYGPLVRSWFIRIGRHTLIWQPVLRYLRGADLIIVEQQSKLLLNYVLIARQWLGRERVAFFGHGKNLQAQSHKTLAERIKKRIALMPHWWFVYTIGVAHYIAGLGYPAERITIFNNAVDTTQLRRWRSSVSAEEIAQARRDLDLTSDNVCIYVGRMSADKRLDFLLSACALIRCAVPDFQMLFVGAGPDALKVERFCAEHAWAHYLGPAFGRELVKLCMLAKLMLVPGPVGLVVLDGFAMRLPMITTDIPFHGPEIEYLENERSGMIVSPADDVARYATVVAGLLRDDCQLAAMAWNCEHMAESLTIENMADRFLDGIVKALAVGK